MKTIVLSLAVIIAFLGTGCPKLYKVRPSTKFEQDQLTAQMNDYLQNRQMAYYCSITKTEVDYNHTTFKYECGDTPVTKEEGEAVAKRLRNEALEEGVAVINGVYGKFSDDLQVGRATTNLVADIIDLGLGAATGISKGERPLQILGVSLTAFRGGRNSVDLNFFREQTIPVLVNKMDDNRTKIYAQILEKKGRDVNQYQMAEAVRDLVDYFNAGTLVRAFSELSKDTAVKAKANEEKLIRLKGLTSLDTIPSEEIIQPSIAIDEQLSAIRKDLQSVSPKLQERARLQLELIYPFITKDKAFEKTIETFQANGDDEDAAIFVKIGNKEDLTPDELYEFVYGIYEHTEGNLDLTRKLERIFAKTKPQN